LVKCRRIVFEIGGHRPMLRILLRLLREHAA
jgi:hypothetical protein